MISTSYAVNAKGSVGVEQHPSSAVGVIRLFYPAENPSFEPERDQAAQSVYRLMTQAVNGELSANILRRLCVTSNAALGNDFDLAIYRRVLSALLRDNNGRPLVAAG